MNSATLKSALCEWTNWDGAAYRLAIALGVMQPADSFQTTMKHVFWSDNPLGSALYHILDTLVSAGVLLRRDEPDIQLRWNDAFRPN